MINSSLDELENKFEKLTLNENISEDIDAKIPKNLQKNFKELLDIVSLPLKYPEYFEKLKVDCPKGVLLYGPPGVGKTLLVQLVSNYLKCSLTIIQGPEIYSPIAGESERLLNEKFNIALNSNNSNGTILFIDEIDSLAPARNDDSNSVEIRVVAQLLTLMDGLNHKSANELSSRLVVIGATNRPNDIDPALRRPGRFDREVNISVPDESARFDILNFCLQKLILDNKLDNNVNLYELAKLTIGYVGADLSMLCREAMMQMILESSTNLNSSSTDLKLKQEYLIDATKRIQPSLKRHETSYAPKSANKLSWDQVGGLSDVKDKLIKAIEWPMLHSESYTRLGLKPSKGVLLYGPPGCSKTTLIRIIAQQMNINMFTVQGAQLYSSLVGESEKMVQGIFDRARKASPSIIFIDEIDTLIGKRSLDGGGGGKQDVVQERILSMMLNEMDGVSELSNVLTIGATNRPDQLDAALLRPGRFDIQVYVPPPDIQARYDILKVYTKGLKIDSNVNLEAIAEKTELFTGADLENLCREVCLIETRKMLTQLNGSMEGLNELDIALTKDAFDEALEMIRPSLTQDQIYFYTSYNQSLSDK
ncbi:AAA-domain-containing protein [Conidiobolus coronatus NRRL 28638]|uniref:AAA-domain-containing protein n=1 Tax=Conidiobolus coronatus (strain ATCC 28846 / CBS 209.66 / NRRL 28638) TaxID=796925 RepID=A0A137PA33_CONC2|nr:AAA-domain-containing protein [Conidiobolus coronatus NRRL 28638]|eukprot:KXN71863.1 AAA-domain-containing protein [Conidiobolus coronatus NRRL 28638]